MADGPVLSVPTFRRAGTRVVSAHGGSEEEVEDSEGQGEAPGEGEDRDESEAARREAPRKKKRPPRRRRRRRRSSATPPSLPPRQRVPLAELRARKEVVLRALDDVRNLLSDVDPLGDPVGFHQREQQAMAIFDQISSLVPATKPLTDKQRAKLERDLADKPDDETLRAMLMEMERMLDDPSIPEELKAVISRDQIRDALTSLDEVALLTPMVSKIHELVADLHTPRVRDPKAALVRQELEREAAKRRS